MLAEVTADRLTLRRDQGSLLTFLWRGPSLADEFTVGEAVTYERNAEGWHIVRSETRTAAALSQTGILSWPGDKQIPEGPAYVVEPSCEFSRGTLFRLRATWEGETVDLEVGESKSLGAWQIMNATHYVSGCAPVPQCHPTIIVAIFTLGPGR